MTSKIEKAIERARTAFPGPPPSPAVRAQEDQAPARTVRKKAGAAVTGVFRGLSTTAVSESAMEQNRILPALDDKGAIAAYKVLRTRVLQRLRTHAWSSFIVTASGPGEGKTLTSCNLATSISRDVNQSVALVDLDLQHPSIGTCFGLDIDLGIGDYLAGDAEIEDIVYAPAGFERLAIIPNRAPVDNASELIASPRMKELMDWLKGQSSARFAIFDMPPILAGDDVLACLPLVDALLLIVSEGQTSRNQLNRAMEMIGDANLLGVVLNKTREQHKSLGYY